MLRHVHLPTTVLQCHPKWFRREVVEKRRVHEVVYDMADTYRVRDWPQNLIVLNSAMPPEGFYAT